MVTSPLPDSALDAEKLKAEIAKALAEAKKADLEAEELRTPWLFKPPVMTALATILVTVGAGVTAYVNGWFGTKAEGLQVKQERLQYENEKLDDRKDDLSKQVNALSTQRDSLRKQVSDLRTALQKAQTDLNSEKSKNTDLEMEEQFRINHPNLNPGNSVLFHIDDSSYKPIDKYKITYANGEEFPCYPIARGVCFHPRTQDEETDHWVRVRITADGYKAKDYSYPSTAGGGPAIVLSH
jgi:hypothetical protein